MSTDITHLIHYPCSLARLYGALTDPQYWADRAQTMAGGGGEMLSCNESADAPVFTAVVRQVIPTTSIPAALKRFAPGTVSVICTESWNASGADEANGSFSSTVQSMPATVDASVALRAVGADSCDMHFSGTVTAKLPVVGAAIEKMMVAETAEGFEIEREFTLDWLRRQER